MILEKYDQTKVKGLSQVWMGKVLDLTEMEWRNLEEVC